MNSESSSQSYPQPIDRQSAKFAGLLKSCVDHARRPRWPDAPRMGEIAIEIGARQSQLASSAHSENEKQADNGDATPEATTFVSSPEIDLSLARLFQRASRQTVILGASGCGKTVGTELAAAQVNERTAEQLISGEVAPEDAEIILRAPASAIADCGDPIEACFGGIGSGFDDLKPLLISKLHKGQATLIADGLDELSEAQTEKLEGVLARLIDTEARVVLTCRPGAWPGRSRLLPPAWQTVAPWEIGPLNAAQLKHYLERRLPSKEHRNAIVETLARHPRVRELSRSILGLEFLCQAGTAVLSGSLTVSALYDRRLDQLIDLEWKARDGSTRDWTAAAGVEDSRIARTRVLSCLPAVGLSLFLEGPGRRRFSFSSWEAALPAEGLNPGETLLGLEQTGLISEAGAGHWEFAHETWLTTLASRALALKPVEEWRRVIVRHLGFKNGEFVGVNPPFSPLILDLAERLDDAEPLNAAIVNIADFEGADQFFTMSWFRVEVALAAGAALPDLIRRNIAATPANLILMEIRENWFAEKVRRWADLGEEPFFAPIWERIGADPVMAEGAAEVLIKSITKRRSWFDDPGASDKLATHHKAWLLSTLQAPEVGALLERLEKEWRPQLTEERSNYAAYFLALHRHSPAKAREVFAELTPEMEAALVGRTCYFHKFVKYLGRTNDPGILQACLSARSGVSQALETASNETLAELAFSALRQSTDVELPFEFCEIFAEQIRRPLPDDVRDKLLALLRAAADKDDRYEFSFCLKALARDGEPESLDLIRKAIVNPDGFRFGKIEFESKSDSYESCSSEDWMEAAIVGGLWDLDHLMIEMIRSQLKKLALKKKRKLSWFVTGLPRLLAILGRIRTPAGAAAMVDLIENHHSWDYDAETDLTLNFEDENIRNAFLDPLEEMGHRAPLPKLAESIRREANNILEGEFVDATKLQDGLLILGRLGDGSHLDLIRALRDFPDPPVAGSAAMAEFLITRRANPRMIRQIRDRESKIEKWAEVFGSKSLNLPQLRSDACMRELLEIRFYSLPSKQLALAAPPGPSHDEENCLRELSYVLDLKAEWGDRSNATTLSRRLKTVAGNMRLSNLMTPDALARGVHWLMGKAWAALGWIFDIAIAMIFAFVLTKNEDHFGVALIALLVALRLLRKAVRFLMVGPIWELQMAVRSPFEKARKRIQRWRWTRSVRNHPVMQIDTAES